MFTNWKTALFWVVVTCVWPLALHAQSIVYGRVTGAEGEPLPGATVQLRGSMTGVSTDLDGNFMLEGLPKGRQEIKISFVGYAAETMVIELPQDGKIEVVLKEQPIVKDEVVVMSTRAKITTPTTYSNIGKDKIQERNLGQDLPILLNFTPSVITTSDAGAGVGYTGMRIRGSDGTAINVTVNGIPINDSESHGVFWVNMPDLASSVSNIQVQRGVGTSSNGAAAFGATVNLQTTQAAIDPFVRVESGVGSFNTFRNNVTLNSGMLNGKFNFEGRLSKIVSDGYIDRSAADLTSYFMSGGYYTAKTMVKFITFGGREITQQAWYGTPEARLTNDSQGLQDVLNWSGEYNTPAQVDNLLNSGRRFNYYLYDNEIDNYRQDHYQLHVSQTLTDNLTFTGALHYTCGLGYFEQYRYNDRLSNYKLAPVTIGDSTISRSDIIRRRWLDNHFLGGIYAFNYQKQKLDITLGGGYNYYTGDHFGEIVWAEFAAGSNIRDRYYEGIGQKKDFNTYLKANYQLTNKLNLFGDMQFRAIDYKTSGTENNLRQYDTGGDYVFFNPKAGLTYQVAASTVVYASVAIGNREPVRRDFIDAPGGVTPKHETLRNMEAGIRKMGQQVSFEANYFLMDYRNQLVQTGLLNDVGASIRTNVDRSYRTGVELQAIFQPFPFVRWSPNLTLSRNIIRDFTEVLYDYAFNFDEEGFVVENQFRDTPISFSPSVIAASDLTFLVGGVEIQLLGKYVGRQFLDNTGNKNRSIDPYFINDLRIGYTLNERWIKQATINLMVNNVFDVMYSSNGYTWGYLYDGSQYQQNNFYPQAGRNFLIGVSLMF